MKRIIVLIGAFVCLTQGYSQIKVIDLYEVAQGSVALTMTTVLPSPLAGEGLGVRGGITNQYLYTPYGMQKNLNHPVHVSSADASLAYSGLFNQTRKPFNITNNQFGYTGQAADASTGLMMLGHFRNYAPGIGRFIQPDTYNSFSKYHINNPDAYVDDNPEAFVDASGHVRQQFLELLVSDSDEDVLGVVDPEVEAVVEGAEVVASAFDDDPEVQEEMQALETERSMVVSARGPRTSADEVPILEQLNREQIQGLRGTIDRLQASNEEKDIKIAALLQDHQRLNGIIQQQQAALEESRSTIMRLFSAREPVPDPNLEEPSIRPTRSRSVEPRMRTGFDQRTNTSLRREASPPRASGRPTFDAGPTRGGRVPRGQPGERARLDDQKIRSRIEEYNRACERWRGLTQREKTVLERRHIISLRENTIQAIKGLGRNAISNYSVPDLPW